MRDKVVGRRLDDIFNDFGAYWHEITCDDQIRWVNSQHSSELTICVITYVTILVFLYLNTFWYVTLHYSQLIIFSDIHFHLQIICSYGFKKEIHSSSSLKQLTIAIQVVYMLLSVPACNVHVLQIGPEKGVTHLATAAVINALWDLWAKMAGKVRHADVPENKSWVHYIYNKNTYPHTVQI